MKERGNRNTKKEAVRIRSVADLHGAIEYFDAMYGVENAELILPDGRPLVTMSFVQRTREDGARASQLIVSDKWPRGMRNSARYRLYNVVDGQD